MDINKTTISIKDARRLAVSAQGLHTRFPFGRGKNGVLRAIRHIGYVQIDTISVVERAHHHIIWSRVPNYQKKQLQQLQENDKQIFEHWGHAMSYLPMEDFKFTLPIKRYFKEHHDPWPKSDPKLKALVLERVEQEGPLMAKDFEALRDRTGDGWWDWKPAKLALERLYYEGTLIVTHRKGFQKVYDIPERALPEGVDLTEPSVEEYARYLIRRTIQAHGFASTKSMAYLRKGMGRPVQEQIRHLCRTGEIIPINIQRLPHDYFTTQKQLNKIPPVQKIVRFLSPFDNMVIQRNRLSNIFHFDYQIECYVPAAKRKYGYFSLPVLLGTELVGRADMKANRKDHVLHIQNLVFEDGFKINDLFLAKFTSSLEAFSKFQECTEIQIHRCVPESLQSTISKSIDSFS